MAVLLIKKSLARRVYATILNAGTNTDGSKEQGGHEGRKRAWITRNGEVEHARLDTVMPCPATTLPYHYSTLPYHYHYPALPLPYPTLPCHYPILPLPIYRRCNISLWRSPGTAHLLSVSASWAGPRVS